MYPRVEYEMTEDDLKELIEAAKPVPYMVVGGIPPLTPQKKANDAWARLGRKMGFQPMTVKPVPGKGQRFFTAVPIELESRRKEREARRRAEMNRLRVEIKEREQRLAELESTP